MTSGMGRVWVESAGYFFLLTRVFFFKQIKNILKFKKIIIKNSTKLSLQETIFKSTLLFYITFKVVCLWLTC
jgi:hypothetical protein